MRRGLIANKLEIVITERDQVSDVRVDSQGRQAPGYTLQLLTGLIEMVPVEMGSPKE